MTSKYPHPNRVCSPGLERLLVRLNIADAKEIAGLAEAHPGMKAPLALSAAGKTTEEAVTAVLSKDLNVERVELKNPRKLEFIRKTGLLEEVEGDFLVAHRCLPFERRGGMVEVAIVDPLDLETISQLEFKLAAKVQLKLVKESELMPALDRLLGIQQAENMDLQEVRTETDAELDLEGRFREDGLSDEAGSATTPVVKFVNQILTEAHRAHASDIHLEPSAATMDVRYRVDGIMTPQLSIPKRLQSYVTTRIKILSGMDITEKRRPQDGRFRMRADNDEAVDVRTSTVPTAFGEKLVLRLLRADVTDLSLSSLFMPPNVLQTFRDLMKSRDRIVLVCGPTGSGKTTTLYAALSDLHRGDTNIITVEDPIEIRLNGITQIQVDAKVGMTFASGLRSILRQDPDIILVGEVRDLETAEVAFQAAQTGHFVLSTLHTNSTVAAIVRLLDLGLEPFIVAAGLGGVLSQRLLRRICPSCRAEVSEDTARASAQRFGLNPAMLRRGAGCEECEGTGYKGRVAAYSLLVVNAAIRELIRARADEGRIQEAARIHGMQDLFTAGLDLVESGQTTLEEVERVIGLGEFLDRGAAAAPSVSVVIPIPQPVPARPKQEDPDIEAIRKSEGPSIDALAEEYRNETVTKTSNRKRVLLVDDDEGVRAVLTRILRKADFEVCEAANGYEALDRLGTFEPDVIVSDLVMPGMDGKELVGEIRRDGRMAKVPVLVLTGSDDEENEIELISLGANDFVSKSSSPVLVITRVRRLLER